MNVAAIIAEYNPFHNGHFYQLNTTREQLHADYIVVILSGNFVQRGAPAICSKYLRAEMALRCGADAVIELPARYALSSAEQFAGGAISLLNQLNIIQYLSFGSECGDVRPLWDYAQLLCHSYEDLEFLHLLQTYQKEGLSFPSARDKAMKQYFSNEKNISLLPNNILGIEYCKSILMQHSSIKPFTILRCGEGYHSPILTSAEENRYASASALRQAIKSGSNSAFSEQFPAPVYELIKEHDLFRHYLTENDFSLLLHYKLLSEQSEGFSSYLDCSKELSDKIVKHLSEFTDFEQFCMLLKSKELTYTRISRVLMHILLNLKKEESAAPVVPYARLLGFRKESADLLRMIKEKSDIPLITKLADADKILDESALTLLNQDIQCAHIYESVYAAKTKKTAHNEYRQSPVIL